MHPYNSVFTTWPALRSRNQKGRNYSLTQSVNHGVTLPNQKVAVLSKTLREREKLKHQKSISINQPTSHPCDSITQSCSLKKIHQTSPHALIKKIRRERMAIKRICESHGVTLPELCGRVRFLKLWERETQTPINNNTTHTHSIRESRRYARTKSGRVRFFFKVWENSNTKSQYQSINPHHTPVTQSHTQISRKFIKHKHFHFF